MRNTGLSINLPLLALAIGAFAIGTTEFSPMGFLPEIAHDLHIAIPQAGLLISAYAVGVMIGAPLMTLWFSRYSKRNALILLMAIFTVGNLLAASAPSYLSLIGARLITSLNHGAFFGIGSVVPPLQMRVMSVVHEAPGLASSVNIGAFNLGNAVGAAAGAAVLNAGWSYQAVSYSGAVLSTLALVLVILQMKVSIPINAAQPG
ncbi:MULTISPECIES: MFS transporter [Acinetobacter]|uniref:MFS transporter n=1 Tax=Acinetobacter entericus TaxID=2989714 RepID=A0ABT3NLG7_9GAMM|nr:MULTISPECIES: MFS transporter [Acinetobacter]MCW8040398.1 MFS transporter [Acinetobacter entericus]TCB76132.1 MFS transporter [Acinetobacter sp. ANC 4177]